MSRKGPCRHTLTVCAAPGILAPLRDRLETVENDITEMRAEGVYVVDCFHVELSRIRRALHVAESSALLTILTQ